MSQPKRVLFFHYTNGANYPPILHSTRILADRGHDILVLGIERAGESMEFEAHPSIRVRNLDYHKPGSLQKLHYLRYAGWVFNQVRRFRPDWCYASDLWSCPIGLGLSHLGYRVIYHEHDRFETTAPSRFVRACLSARARLAPAAELCVLPNHERTRVFAREHPGAQTVTVLNCASRRDIGPARTERNGLLGLYYHGSIVPERLPAAVLDALVQCPNVKLTIRGYSTIGAPGYAEELSRRAQQLGIADRVEHLPQAPLREQLWPQMAEMDVGLTVVPAHATDTNLDLMAGASNKPFDYLARGLPLLFSQRADWMNYFAPYGRPCIPEDGTSIAAALTAFDSDRELVRALGAAGQARCQQEWNYEHQFEPVLRVIDG